MTIVDAINAIADWLNENVCPKLLFKKADDRNVADSYTLREVHPTAYAMFYPNDLIPEEKRGDPFIVVTPSKGKRDTVSKAERLTVQLSFRTWNPGTHAAELAGKSTACASSPAMAQNSARSQRMGNLSTNIPILPHTRR